ncbi:hypothetical protein B0H10DRAFT_637603 [Mycena sp. CBHHK59/15]|nr:hypothetical protein B0H10DRAFT_637603 [Mycena sp. CBHHK59/15]
MYQNPIYAWGNVILIALTLHRGYSHGRDAASIPGSLWGVLIRDGIAYFLWWPRLRRLDASLRLLWPHTVPSSAGVQLSYLSRRQPNYDLILIPVIRCL